jgi:hypothetical protein
MAHIFKVAGKNSCHLFFYPLRKVVMKFFIDIDIGIERFLEDWKKVPKK